VENIPQVSANRAEDAQNYDAHKAVSATLSVGKWRGPIFRPGSSTPSVRSFYLCVFHWKLRPSRVSLESARLENISQVRLNCAKVAQNDDARKAVSATLSVLKWSEAIFWPRSPTPSVRSFYLCPFYWKLRPPCVCFEPPGVENIPQVTANPAIVAQNHDVRKAVPSTLSVVKWSGALFWPRSSTPIVRSFHLCQFHWKLGDQELVWCPTERKISPKFWQVEAKLLKITMRVGRSWLLFQS